MKQLSNFFRVFFLLGIVAWNHNAHSQCTNTSKWPSSTITAPTGGATLTISSAYWAGEYAVLGSTTASSYTVTSTEPDYITIRQGSYNGPAIAYGLQPLTWISSGIGDYYVHFNTIDCGEESVNRTTKISHNNTVMVYQSTTVTQSNTSTILSCEPNQEIIRIEVLTAGSLSPIDITKFIIQTNGSTNPSILNNVSNIDIFYTGSNPNFSANGLFASKPPQTPGGEITFPGSQTLLPGSNYFWVAFDMSISSAVLGDVVDARLTHLIVGGTNKSIGAAGDPSGNRTIVLCGTSPAGIVDNNTFWINGFSGLLVNSDNKVSEWSSAAPGFVSISQSNTIKQPIYHDSNLDFNYNPHLKFDGIDDDLYNTATSSLLGGTGTVFIVSSNESGTGGGSALTYENSNIHYQIKPYFNCGYSQYGNPEWQGSWEAATSIASPYGRPQIIGLKGGSNVFNFRNGLINNSTIVNPGFGAVVGTGLRLGSNYGNGEWVNAGIAEVIFYNRSLDTSELNKIQSYLAIKYGITMGVNGISTNYYSPNGSVIWNVSANTGFNYDIAGIGREDIGQLNQRKSHSINGPDNTTYNDILTVANGEDFDNPSNLPNNSSYFIWGHNNAPTQSDFDLYVEEPVKIRFMRTWKAQESGNVGTVTLEFNMSEVPGNDGLIPNDLNEVRLLVSTTNSFGSSTTPVPPSFVDNATQIVRFQHDFNSTSGFFFTLGSVNLNLTPLPVTLTEFKANCKGQSAELNWTTQSETNNAFFTVEKSTDARNFKPVETIEGHGTSTSTINYSWTDKAQTPGIAYYRLKQTDFDGAFEYHDVISINCREEFPFLIYPNPTRDRVFIQHYNSSDSGLEIDVFNVLGEIVYRKEILDSGWINLPDAQGIYFIRVKNEDKFYIEKVVKN